MSREFNGSSDVIDFDAGGVASIPVSGMAIGILWKPLSSHRGGYFDGYNSGFRQLGINPFDNGSCFFARNGGASIDYSAYIGDWAQLWWTCPTAGGTIRTHQYTYEDDTWLHDDHGTAGARDPLDHFTVGSFDGGQWLHARVAVMAFKSADLSDLALESSGCVSSLAGWASLAPAALLRFDQAVNTDPVVDVMASGTAQLTSTDPAVSGDEPPGFSYGGGDTGAARRFLSFF